MRALILNIGYVVVGACFWACATAVYRIAQNTRKRDGADVLTYVAFAALFAVFWIIGFSAVRGWIAMAAHSRTY